MRLIFQCSPRFEVSKVPRPVFFNTLCFLLSYYVYEKCYTIKLYTFFRIYIRYILINLLCFTLYLPQYLNLWIQILQLRIDIKKIQLFFDRQLIGMFYVKSSFLELISSNMIACSIGVLLSNRVTVPTQIKYIYSSAQEIQDVIVNLYWTCVLRFKAYELSITGIEHDVSILQNYN